MKYWERWIGDWKRKTAHLNAEAKGIYGELLDHSYATEQGLPLEAEDLYRIAGAATASERKACDRVVAEFFTRDDAGHHNQRAAEEISRRQNYVARQAEFARRRWEREIEPKPKTAKRSAARGNGEDQPQSGAIWAAYASAYRERYGVEPTRNARSNAILKQFSARVPLEDAPKIAALYLRSPRALYVGAKHPLTLLLRDAEALRTEFLSGEPGASAPSGLGNPFDPQPGRAVM